MCGIPEETAGSGRAYILKRPVVGSPASSCPADGALPAHVSTLFALNPVQTLTHTHGSIEAVFSQKSLLLLLQGNLGKFVQDFLVCRHLYSELRLLVLSDIMLHRGDVRVCVCVSAAQLMCP